MKMSTVSLTVIGVLLTLVAVGYFNLTVFVVQPIGALPEGRTLIMKRSGQLRFIDSADAICERINGGVSLLCRGAVLGRVVDEEAIYLRLPYSHQLYLISTNGAEYDR